MGTHTDRNGERDRRDERAEYDERYRQRYQGQGADDRFGRFDEDRGRDDDRMRYQGRGGQSGSQSGNMSDNMYREQTGFRGEDMYDRGRGNSEQRGYGGGYGGQQMGMGGQRFDGQGGQGGQQQDWRQGQQDWQRVQQGGGPVGGPSHRGKGPSGYMRSDERIREEVCDALTDDDHVDASHIEIQVKNGEVTLSGTVPDRRTKRLAEDCIDHVRGVKDVSNNIRVQEDRHDAGNGGGRSQSVSSSPDKDTEHSKRPRA